MGARWKGSMGGGKWDACNTFNNKDILKKSLSIGESKKSVDPSTLTILHLVRCENSVL